MLSKEEFEDVQSLHINESWWYLFLNYGCPLPLNKEYEEKFNAISKALVEYIDFVNQTSDGSERQIYL